MTTTRKLDIVQQLLADRPSFHLSGEARWDALPSTLHSIRSCVRSDDTTFEIGVGASTVVFAASGAIHTAVSPDPAEHERVRSYCQEIGIDDSRLTFVTGLSEDVLPSLLSRDRTLDVALVDGAHSFPIPIIDWYYVARSLRVGGKLLLDDIPIPAVAQAFRHMRLEPNWRLEGIFDGRAALFTLLAQPDPKDDWLTQPFNAGYPDFSFARVPRRLSLAIAYRFTQLRREIVQRYPGLRRTYKRLV
jgi:predicted O-methyltransferase YrrM